MKTRKNPLLTIAIAAAIGTTTFLSHAEEGERKGKPGEDRPERPSAEEIFKKLDANGDGEIGPKELSEGHRFQDADKKEVAEAFGRLDKNGDGKVGPREFKEGFAERGGKGKGKGKGKGEGKGKGKGKGKGEGGKGKGGKGGGS